MRNIVLFVTHVQRAGHYQSREAMRLGLLVPTVDDLRDKSDSHHMLKKGEIKPGQPLKVSLASLCDALVPTCPGGLDMVKTWIG